MPQFLHLLSYCHLHNTQVTEGEMFQTLPLPLGQCLHSFVSDAVVVWVNDELLRLRDWIPTHFSSSKFSIASSPKYLLSVLVHSYPESNHDCSTSCSESAACRGWSADPHSSVRGCFPSAPRSRRTVPSPSWWWTRRLLLSTRLCSRTVDRWFPPFFRWQCFVGIRQWWCPSRKRRNWGRSRFLDIQHLRISIRVPDKRSQRFERKENHRSFPHFPLYMLLECGYALFYIFSVKKKAGTLWNLLLFFHSLSSSYEHMSEPYCSLSDIHSPTS